MKDKPKKQYRKKDYSVVDKTVYIRLCPADSVYLSQQHLFVSEDFHCPIHRLLRDLNFFLQFNDKDFQQEITISESLKLALESCLAILPRKAYNLYRRDKNKQEGRGYEDSLPKYKFEVLMEVVLKIYYRISQLAGLGFGKTIYNEWILDLPKMLDLVAIYGESNPKIVSQIIQTLYDNIPEYEEDTGTFFSILDEKKLEQIQRQLISPVNLAENVEFDDRKINVKAEIKIFMKSLFGCKDLLFNITNFMGFFPYKYAGYLACDHKIQQKTIWTCCSFFAQLEHSWNLSTHEHLLADLIEDLRQSIIKHLGNILTFIKSSTHSKDQTFKVYGEQAYEMLCLLMIRKKAQPPHKYYLQFIDHLIESSPQESVFSMKAEDIKDVPASSVGVIKACQEYELMYRKALQQSSAFIRFNSLVLSLVQRKPPIEEMSKQPARMRFKEAKAVYNAEYSDDSQGDIICEPLDIRPETAYDDLQIDSQYHEGSKHSFYVQKDSSKKLSQTSTKSSNQSFSMISGEHANDVSSSSSKKHDISVQDGNFNFSMSSIRQEISLQEDSFDLAENKRILQLLDSDSVVAQTKGAASFKKQVKPKIKYVQKKPLNNLNLSFQMTNEQQPKEDLSFD